MLRQYWHPQKLLWSISFTSFPCFAMHPLGPNVTTAHWQRLARNSSATSGSAFSSPLHKMEEKFTPTAENCIKCSKKRIKHITEELVKMTIFHQKTMLTFWHNKETTDTLEALLLHPHWQSRGLYPLTPIIVEEVI